MEEKTISSQQIWQGKFLTLREDKVTLPNGHEAVRYIIEHPGAVAIIPVTKNKEIIMVEQFRKPVERVLLELPAGKLEKGEDPLVSAGRELQEETGCVAGKLEKLGSFYSGPGFTNEILYLYLATDLEQQEACPDEDEFVAVKTIPLDEALQMIEEGKICDGKTIIGLLWADRILGGKQHADSLR